MIEESRLSRRGTHEDEERTRKEQRDTQVQSSEFYLNKARSEYTERLVEKLDEELTQAIEMDLFNRTIGEHSSLDEFIPAPKAREVTERMLKDLAEIDYAIADVITSARNAEAAEKEATFRRFQWAILGLSIPVTVGGALFELISLILNNLPHDHIKIAPDKKAWIEQTVKAWVDQSDENLWLSVAKAADTGLVLDSKPQPFSIADQIAFMMLMINLCPAKHPFKWDTVPDAEESVKKIKGFYDHNKKTSDIYRNVLKVTYKNKPLQREFAAKQIILVLGQILSE